MEYASYDAGDKKPHNLQHQQQHSTPNTEVGGFGITEVGGFGIKDSSSFVDENWRTRGFLKPLPPEAPEPSEELPQGLVEPRDKEKSQNTEESQNTEKAKSNPFGIDDDELSEQVGHNDDPKEKEAHQIADEIDSTNKDTKRSPQAAESEPPPAKTGSAEKRKMPQLVSPGLANALKVNVNLKGPKLSTNLKPMPGLAKSTGQALPKELRQEVEPGLGFSTKDVRVHNNEKSYALNEKVNARAFAYGKDLYFGRGQYNPNSRSGKKLIAHELAHVNQGTSKIRRWGLGDVWNGAKKRAKQAWNGAKQVGSNLKRTAQGAVHKAKTTAKRVYHGAKSTAKRVYNSAGTAAKRGVQQAKTFTNRAVNGAKRTYHKAKSTAKRVYHNAKTTAKRTYYKAKTAAKSTYHSAKTTAQKAVQKAKTTTRKVTQSATKTLNGATAIVKNVAQTAKALPGNVGKTATRIYKGAEQWLTRNPKAAMALGAVAVVGGIGLTIATGGLAGLAIGGALAGAGTSTLLQGANIADGAKDANGKPKTFSLAEVGAGALLGGAGGAIGGPVAAAAFKAAPTAVGLVGAGALGMGAKSAHSNWQQGNQWTAVAEGALAAPGALPFMQGKSLSAMFGKQALNTTGRSAQALVNGKAIQGALQGGKSVAQSAIAQGRQVLGFRQSPQLQTAGGNPEALGRFEPRVHNGTLSADKQSTTAGTTLKTPEKSVGVPQNEVWSAPEKKAHFSTDPWLEKQGYRPKSRERSVSKSEYKALDRQRRSSERWASGAYSAKSADVQPRHMTKLEHARIFKSKGNLKQAAKYIRELKAEMGPERYEALKRAYSQQTPRGSALAGNKLEGDPYRVSDKHIDLMRPSERFSKNAQLREPLHDYFDVIAHGVEKPGAPTIKIRLQTSGRDVEINHRTLAKILKTQKSYNGESIRLLSCSTGNASDCFAQNLANKLNKEVLAPSNTVWFGQEGELAVGSSRIWTNSLTGERKTIPNEPFDGKWNTFSPKGTNTTINHQPELIGTPAKELHKNQSRQERLSRYRYNPKSRTYNELKKDLQLKLRTGENEAQMQHRVRDAQAELDKRNWLPEGNKPHPGITKQQWRDLRTEERQAAIDQLIQSSNPELQAARKLAIERRMKQLSSNGGHGPQRHGPQITEQQLDDRAMHKIDPVTGTTDDAYNKFSDGTPRPHKAGRHATHITSNESFVRGEIAIRNSQKFKEAIANANANGLEYTEPIDVPLEQIYGSGYRNHVSGKSRIGSANNSAGTTVTDFTDGMMKAFYRKTPDGRWVLHTMYPNPQ
jgi:hypothetical protein